MAKKAYVGVGGVARKIKKGYIGIGGKARKIKKAYIGVGGVARPCWSGGEIVYYGPIAALSPSREKSTPVSLNGNAIFGGGMASASQIYKTVQRYDNSLTISAIADRPHSFYSAAANTIGNHVVFVGGHVSNTDSRGYIDSYDSNYTLTSLPEYPNWAGEIGSCHAGDYALFGGGYRMDREYYNSCIALSSTLTQSILSNLSYKGVSTGADAGSIGVFVQKTSGGSTCNAQSYNSSLTRSNAVSLTNHYDDETERKYGIVSFRGYCVVAGGAAGYNKSNAITRFDSSFTKTSGGTLSQAGACAGFVLGDYAVFTQEGSTDIFDASFTKIIGQEVPNNFFTPTWGCTENYAIGQDLDACYAYTNN